METWPLHIRKIDRVEARKKPVHQELDLRCSDGELCHWHQWRALPCSALLGDTGPELNHQSQMPQVLTHLLPEL